METYLIAFAVFGVVIAAMAIGVIFSNRCIHGSCGGLSNAKDDSGRPIVDACADCPHRKPECEAEQAGRRGSATAGQPRPV